MIDHLGISVGSIARATEFYLKALAPLGYGIVMEVSAEETGHGAAIAFGAPGQAADFQSGKPSFWVGESAKASGPLHVAFVAPSRAAVDVFYHAAIAAGGADHGAPGLRPQYHAAYYAAFVLDPDGNNIEAVCHQIPLSSLAWNSILELKHATRWLCWQSATNPSPLGQIP